MSCQAARLGETRVGGHMGAGRVDLNKWDDTESYVIAHHDHTTVCTIANSSLCLSKDSLDKVLITS